MTGTSVSPARRAARQPALAGDKLESVSVRADKQRMQDALLADRLRELVEFGLGEMTAYRCARANEIDRGA